jgi:hypothetical protein
VVQIGLASESSAWFTVKWYLIQIHTDSDIDCWCYVCFVMRSARAVMTVAVHVCANAHEKKAASGAPNPLAHCDMKVPGHC